MRKRTRSREFALQLLYQIDLSGASPDEVYKDFWTKGADPTFSKEEKKAVEQSKKDQDVRRYADQLVRGTLENLAAIDKLIEKFTENWEMKRMAYIDRNILRLASFEILYLEDIPVKVAINEAVELAKRYGESDSSKFVNGILDRIAKTECKK